MTLNPPPSERELQIARITGMTPRRQRYWLARGFGLDVWGNMTAPRTTEQSAT